MERDYKNALKKQKGSVLGDVYKNVLKNAIYENDARKFWTTLKKENVNKNVFYMNSANDFAR